MVTFFTDIARDISCGGNGHNDNAIAQLGRIAHQGISQVDRTEQAKNKSIQQMAFMAHSPQ
jgi:hypothetical protein